MADEVEPSSTWQILLLIATDDEGDGEIDPVWMDDDWLEGYFGENAAARWEDVHALVKLGAVITNEHGEFMVNLDYLQGPTIAWEPEKPPKRAYLNSR